MKIENGILYGVSNVNIVDGKFVVPSGVKSIGQYAFQFCSSLESIIIPSRVESIGNYAFNGCNSLKSVTFEEGSALKSIGNGAFQCCSSIGGITIPNGVESIGNYAFSDCSSLTSITFDDESALTSIGGGAFDCCSSLMNIIIPSRVECIETCAFYSCDKLRSLYGNYKAFTITKNGGLQCRHKVYKEGVVNSIRGDLAMCVNGIHYCTNLFEIFNYYHDTLDKDIAIYEIEVGDRVLTSNTSKCCTNSCALKRRLYREDVIRILNGREINGASDED